MQLPSLSELNLGLTVPALSLALWACILLVIDLFIPRDRKSVTAWLAAGGVVFAFIANLLVYRDPGVAFMGLFVADEFAGFLNIVVLLTAFIAILMSVDYLKRTGIERGEYYVLLLMTTSGIMFMNSANDLAVVFIALELLSIPLYVLAAFRAPEERSEEAGLKYFILGAFASAFFVFGAALIYGATGSSSLPVIVDAVGRALAGEGSSLLLLLMGSGLILAGLGFKVAVVPFHMWTPDVYEGAPTPVTAFMSVGAKVGGFAALLRILLVALPALTVAEGDAVAGWQTATWVVAALTLILGNIVAISQTNIKRLLAYSSIAHAGYVLMAVAAAGTPGVSDQATRAALIYLMAYMFTNLGAFAVAMAIEKDDGSGTSLDDFKGLGRSRPLLAAIMAVFMLSLTGIPLTAGFVGKWVVFQATIEAGLYTLAVIGVLTSVISAFYYVRVIVNMFLEDGEGDPAAAATPYVQWAIYLTFAGTLVLGIIPSLVTNLSGPVALAVASLVP
ncbi:MAG: NADH-quinone oxidoreductase subunit N [Chloroflexota bacterium]|nr:MAG: NADH-quinone oxidoreductase subunit N [Chloroflexota bacterium]